MLPGELGQPGVRIAHSGRAKHAGLRHAYGPKARAACCATSCTPMALKWPSPGPMSSDKLERSKCARNTGVKSTTMAPAARASSMK